jgi:CHAD domain-containing protein
MSYRIDPVQPLEAEIRRIAGEQIAQALAELSEEGDSHEPIHDARKRFKKLRGLFRLVRTGNEEFYRAENARYRDAARRLSASRDQTAMIEALDALKERFSGEIEGTSFDRFREVLEERRQAIAKDRNPRMIQLTRAELENGRRALDGLALPGTARMSGKILGRSFSRTYARARHATAVVARRQQAEDFHELRKRTKYHRFHLRLLRPLWPPMFTRAAEEAERIGDRLGLDHDYSVFRAGLAAEPEAFGPPEDLEVVLRCMERRQSELRVQSFDAARRLFLDSPKVVRRRVSRLYRLAHEDAQRSEAALFEGPDTPAPPT